MILLSVSLILISSRLGVKEKLRQEEDAARRALEVTGDLAATLASSPARPNPALSAARLEALRLALGCAAGPLHCAAGPGADKRGFTPDVGVCLEKFKSGPARLSGKDGAG